MMIIVIIIFKIMKNIVQIKLTKWGNNFCVIIYIYTFMTGFWWF